MRKVNPSGDSVEQAPETPAAAALGAHAARKRRSLWLVCGNEGYGVRRAMLGMAAELQALSVEVVFAALEDGSFAQEIRAAGYPLAVIGGSVDSTAITQGGWRFVGGALQLIVSGFSTQRRIGRAIEEYQPDWAHFRVNRLLVSVGWAGLKAGTPVYWHLPNGIASKLPFGLQAGLYRMLCRLLRIRPLPNSAHTAATLGVPRSEARILYPGIDGRRFSPEAADELPSPAELAEDEGGPLFLIAARLTPAKAQDRVVEAAIRLLEEGMAFKLVLLGGPLGSPYCRQIERRIQESGASSRIKLLGPVADPRAYYRACSVVINSRADAEPFGLSIVEAMLMERPVLAYYLGGPSETVSDGETGWLTQDPSVDGYVDGIRRALRDRERWTSMGQAARRRALERFTVQSVASRYLDFVESDRSEKRRRRPTSLKEARASQA